LSRLKVELSSSNRAPTWALEYALLTLMAKQDYTQLTVAGVFTGYALPIQAPVRYHTPTSGQNILPL
jgi:hypothetical protein